jgi:preprotein translocase subunit SecA
MNEYQLLYTKKPEKYFKDLDLFANGIKGLVINRYPRAKKMLQKSVKIAEQSEQLKTISDEELLNRIEQLKIEFSVKNKIDDDNQDTALSLIAQAAGRILDLYPYPVQIMGALALYKGLLAEMETGEGKTLTIALSATMAGWHGKPCHILTANDYLAERDASELKPLYAFCGLKVGHVISTMSQDDRRENYACDVVYTTGKEILADFLRDRLKLGELQDSTRLLVQNILFDEKQTGCEELVMRGLGTAIVDEADSILIDEAVTPLIISQQVQNKYLEEGVNKALEISECLLGDIHYKVDKKYKAISFTDNGLSLLDDMAETLTGIWQSEMRRNEIVKQAISAREFYRKNKEYIIDDGKICIVDEFTGRLMPSRTWSHGLHQAIEMKEGLEPSKATQVLAKLSFQRFFRLFPKLSGITGTAWESYMEFWQIYNLPIVRIPPNKLCQRKYLTVMFFRSDKEKWEAITESIIQLHQSGRPLLIGTKNVENSEMLAERLKEHGLNFEIINAVRHEEEPAIVAKAGEKYKITIATNMAGRGTDIKLGQGVVELGGLHVIATERHEAIRIDRQLFGRCARQGDPGSVQVFTSIDDEILSRFVPKSLKKFLLLTLHERFNNILGKMLYYYSQKISEMMAAKQRANILKNDTWLDDALSFSGKELSF